MPMLYLGGASGVETCTRTRTCTRTFTRHACMHAHTWAEQIGVGAQRRQQRRRLRIGQRRAARAPGAARHLFACENDRTALPSTAAVEVPARLRIRMST